MSAPEFIRRPLSEPLAEEIVVIVALVTELPRPYVPSVRGVCSRCGELVWVERRVLKLVALPVLVCRPCSGLTDDDLLSAIKAGA